MYAHPSGDASGPTRTSTQAAAPAGSAALAPRTPRSRFMKTTRSFSSKTPGVSSRSGCGPRSGREAVLAIALVDLEGNRRRRLAAKRVDANRRRRPLYERLGKLAGDFRSRAAGGIRRTRRPRQRGRPTEAASGGGGDSIEPATHYQSGYALPTFVEIGKHSASQEVLPAPWTSRTPPEEDSVPEGRAALARGEPAAWRETNGPEGAVRRLGMGAARRMAQAAPRRRLDRSQLAEGVRRAGSDADGAGYLRPGAEPAEAALRLQRCSA